MNRRLFLGGALSLPFLPRSASAQQQGACVAEGGGCWTLRIAAFAYDPNNQLQRQVRDRQVPIHAAAVQMHQQRRAGTARLYPGRVPIQVYTWNTNTHLLSGITSYDNPGGGSRRARLDSGSAPGSNAPRAEGLGLPDRVYHLDVQDNIGMIAFPKAMFRSGDQRTGSYVFVCAPTVQSLVPSREQQNGMYVMTPGTSEYLLGHNVGSTFILMPSAPPIS